MPRSPGHLGRRSQFFVRSMAQAKGISETAITQILKRWADNAKRHDRPFRLFLAFYKTAGVCGICEAESSLTNYASDRIANAYSGADFWAHMGALKQWLSLLCPSIRESVWVTALEAWVRVTNPDRVKYT